MAVKNIKIPQKYSELQKPIEELIKQINRMELESADTYVTYNYLSGGSSGGGTTTIISTVDESNLKWFSIMVS